MLWLLVLGMWAGESLEVRIAQSSRLYLSVRLGVSGAEAVLDTRGLNAEGRVISVYRVRVAPRATTPYNYYFDAPSGVVRIEVEAVSARGRVTMVKGSLNAIDPEPMPGMAGEKLQPESTGPLSRTALFNLMTFGRVFREARARCWQGEWMQADWEAVLLRGVRQLDYAVEPESLGRRVVEVLQPACRSIEWYVGSRGDSEREAEVALGRNVFLRFAVQPTARQWQGPEVARVPFEEYTDADRGTRLMLVLLVYASGEGEEAAVVEALREAATAREFRPIFENLVRKFKFSGTISPDFPAGYRIP